MVADAQSIGNGALGCASRKPRAAGRGRECVRSPRLGSDYLPNTVMNELPGVPRPVTLSQPGPVCCVGEPE